MSLLFTEGFELIDLGGINRKHLIGYRGGSSLYNNTRDQALESGDGMLYNCLDPDDNEVEIVRGTGRLGGDALYLTGDLFNSKTWRMFLGEDSCDELYFGLAYKYSTEGDNGMDVWYFYFHYEYTPGYITNMMRVRLERKGDRWNVDPSTADGSGDYPSIASKDLTDRTDDEWRYLQFGLSFNCTAGIQTGRLRVRSICDEVEWTNIYTGPVLRPDWTIHPSGLSVFMFMGQIPMGTHFYNNMYIDDIYACNNAGSGPCNDFLGAVQVLPLNPKADVAGENDWTPSEVLDHYRLVGEDYIAFDSGLYNTPGDDGDEHYVKTNTDLSDESYEFDDVDLSGTDYSADLLGVCVHIWDKVESDMGLEPHIYPLTYHIGDAIIEGDDLGEVMYDDDDGYGVRRVCFDQDPQAVAAWTETTFNNTRFGFRLKKV